MRNRSGFAGASQAVLGDRAQASCRVGKHADTKGAGPLPGASRHLCWRHRVGPAHRSQAQVTAGALKQPAWRRYASSSCTHNENEEHAGNRGSKTRSSTKHSNNGSISCDQTICLASYKLSPHQSYVMRNTAPVTSIEQPSGSCSRTDRNGKYQLHRESCSLVVR